MLMNATEVMKRLPHRYPFLLVDGIESFTENESIVGIKNVTINEPFFQGHFPGHPIMPGVLIVEAMAQVGGLFASLNDEIGEDKVTYFTGIDKVKFRKPVVPGDVLRMELNLLKCRRGIYQFSGKAYVGETLVTEAELKATFVDREG
ncbi:3-hydroxyacyl-ACP dehydratase FabZ [Desulfuromonas acetoxidans]|uniref:3-hydroxyacyl-[acyl-carrier-protein] dehydratase FabZ n=1 Tax=Desulfuromonas acetoxidans (strain DSM 684 / 11070) TaxID=281689 RepID=Q1K135_DESA6|nr:3-hydroxyacyl-ACP dehydratase FabZ [Desulfuromonas acetoxidans]EAT16173.1 beta-hydroxyacyl-(acyl-carrier-protein) dehydratase FabZ [Desulfuromonas acetoxidans DSM 684]MBF0645951.1 3-hydroxyacyl-ACP dehydratase FabZ [Desulfuromonas acetoxidans]NVD25474.1 3-hydroxyacyl-ACP dehydratase FabZ [Desulfuromonas acetoxidans]NVE17576.1 3-hydroxyacyl-ACP dehydratase FabZ [Desulfuromonas acetoxidans]